MSKFLTTFDIDRMLAIDAANKSNERSGDRLRGPEKVNGKFVYEQGCINARGIMSYYDKMDVNTPFVKQAVKPECQIAFVEAYNKYKQLKNTLCYCITGDATDAMHLSIIALEAELFNNSADWYK